MRSPPKSPNRDAAPQVKVIRCVALHDYAAQEDNELSFKKGDILNDVENEEDPDGWWTGTLNGNRGLFPHNFAKVLVETGEGAAASGGEAPKRKGMVGAVAMPGGVGFDPSAVMLKKTGKI